MVNSAPEQVRQTANTKNSCFSLISFSQFIQPMKRNTFFLLEFSKQKEIRLVFTLVLFMIVRSFFGHFSLICLFVCYFHCCRSITDWCIKCTLSWRRHNEVEIKKLFPKYLLPSYTTCKFEFTIPKSGSLTSIPYTTHLPHPKQFQSSIRWMIYVLKLKKCKKYRSTPKFQEMIEKTLCKLQSKCFCSFYLREKRKSNQQYTVTHLLSQSINFSIASCELSMTFREWICVRCVCALFTIVSRLHFT